MSVENYTIEIEIDARRFTLGSRAVLCDAVADALERQGLTDDEYAVVVTGGPPELHIGVVYR